MNGLLKVESGPGGLLVVSAKALHNVLGVRRRFATWIKDRIGEYEFEDGADYWSDDQSQKGDLSSISDDSDFPNSGNQNSQIKPNGGDRRSQDYWLSMDMAKELAMLERNEAGRAARKYFIQCERELVQAKEDVAKLKAGGPQAQKVEHRQDGGTPGSSLNGLSDAEVQSIRFFQAEWQKHPEVMKGLNSDIEYVVLPFVLLEFLNDMQDKGCVDLGRVLDAVDLHEYGMELVEAVRMGRELITEEDLSYRKTHKAMSPHLIGRLEPSLAMMFKGVRAGRKAARVSRQLKGFGLMGPLG